MHNHHRVEVESHQHRDLVDQIALSNSKFPRRMRPVVSHPAGMFEFISLWTFLQTRTINSLRAGTGREEFLSPLYTWEKSTMLQFQLASLPEWFRVQVKSSSRCHWVEWKGRRKVIDNNSNKVDDESVKNNKRSSHCQSKPFFLSSASIVIVDDLMGKGRKSLIK